MQTMTEEWIELVNRVPLHDGWQIQRAIILRILQRRFQPNEESLQNLAQPLSPVTDDEVFLQLVDLALEVMALPDFHARLQGVIDQGVNMHKYDSNFSNLQYINHST